MLQQLAGTHKGQVSFPGGHIDPTESAISAAIREFREELWSHSGESYRYENISILGTISPLPAVTKTMVN